LKETDLFGRFYLKAPNGGRFEGYYNSLNAIRALVLGREWLRSVTGYYINISGNYDAVRLSYWTVSPEHAREVVNRFVTEHGLKHIKQPTIPKHARNSHAYGGEEMRFRRFLATYTQIGLEIMETDLLNARSLFATFRWQVMRAGKPYKPHFLRTFENQSFFYNALSSAEKEQFWLDLAHWPDPQQVDWAHMFVNMVLGLDWFPVWDNFHSPQPPLSIAEINRRVKRMGFQIQQNWSP
jgi:hypothetical protein